MSSSYEAGTRTEVPQQAPVCPICHKTDQVRTIQTAFDIGVERIAPPAMPTSNARMMPWIIVGSLIYVAGNFYLFIELSSNAQNNWPIGIQIVSIIINLLALIVGLVLSFIAVMRIVRSDRETTSRYPSWDRAMANWNRLYYCLRDKVVIDPQQKRTLSEAELRSLIATDQEPREQNELFTHSDSHRAGTAPSPSNEQS